MNCGPRCCGHKPDPSFVPDEQEKDSPLQAIGFTAIMAFVILFAIFI